MDVLSTQQTWRNLYQDWVLFTNNNVNLAKIEEANAKEKEGKKSEKKSKTLFFFSNRKGETKGSLVYTQKGYGIIQSYSQDLELIPVKLKTGETVEVKRNTLLLDIPLSVKYISDTFNREDKITIPVTSTLSDLMEKLESAAEKELSLSTTIFYGGKEIRKSSDGIDRFGLLPNSKILVVSSLGKPYSVNRFTTTYQGWGYSSTSIDGITFSASKEIKVIGFGIYTPYKSGDQVQGEAKFIAGNDVKGVPLVQKEVSLTMDDSDPENKIHKFYFDRAIRVKAEEQFTCVVELKNGNTFYGSSGQTTMVGENSISFTFSSANGSTNGTSTSSGQCPEIYYYA